MNKKIWIMLSSVIALLLVLLGVYLLLAPGRTEAPAQDTVVVPTYEPVTIKLELTFDSVDDLKWLGFWDYSESQDHAQEDTWKDGFVHLGAGNTFGSLGVNYSLEPGQIVHIRTRAGENTCYSVGIGVDLQGSNKEIRLDGCTGGLYQASTVFNRDHEGDSIFGSMPLSGSVPAFAGEWTDKLIWLNETGDQLYYVITNPDDPVNVMYGAVELPEDWQYDRWGIGVNGFFDIGASSQTSNYVDVDLIRVGTGSLKSYLAEYVPAYLENLEDIDSFLSEVPELMPELQPAQW